MGRFYRFAFVLMSVSTDADAQTESPDRGRAVHVRFAPSQGPRLRRSEPTTCGRGASLWAERPLLMERGDGSYDLLGTSSNLRGLARWILSHGADATVRGPEELRRRVAAEARQIWEKYENT